MIADHPGEWEQILSSVTRIKEILPDLDRRTLSSAAKTYLIVSETEEGVAEPEISELAKRLGWGLIPAQVKRTIGILTKLELLEDGADTEAVPD